MSWNFCGLDITRLWTRCWNYSAVCASEHARSVTASVWRRVWSALICAVSSMTIWWLMMAFNMMGHTPFASAWNGKRSGVVVSAGYILCWQEQLWRTIGKAKQMTLGMLYLGNQKCWYHFTPHLEYAVQVWAPTVRHGNWGNIMELRNAKDSLRG